MSKRFVRIESKRKVAGVCAGIAEYCNTDPTIVRVATVLGTLLTAFFLIAYLILWVCMEKVEK